MAGKMTILDRLRLSGKLKPGVARDFRVRGEFFDPLQYTTQQRILMQGAPERAYMAVPDNGVGREIKVTPERQVYQQGIEARMQPKRFKAEADKDRAYDEMDAYKEEWNEAIDDARQDMMQDWEDQLSRWGDDEPYEYNLEVDPPSSNLRDYWPSYGREPDEIIADYDAAEDNYYAMRDANNRLYRPEAWMQEQTQTPRYRNYQRAMEARAANKRMGHQLSRMWGDAYNRLRARGLSDAEARMFIRERFGGR